MSQTFSFYRIDLIEFFHILWHIMNKIGLFA